LADAPLTIALSPELARELDRLAEETRRDRSSLASEAISVFVAHEQAAVAGIRRGLEDVAAGRTVPHAEAMARVRAAIKKR
jgi:predicted transcriptional regulator